MVTLIIIFFLFHIGLSSSANKRILVSDPSYVHQLEVKLQELTSKVDSIANANQQLTNTNQQLTSKVDNVTSANQQLTGKVDSITSANQQLTTKVDSITSANQQLTTKMDIITNDNQQLKTKLDLLATTVTGLSTGGSGGVYTRWGRTSCPNTTDLVYQGYTGGSWYSHSGAAANYVCMPSDPQYEPDALTGTSNAFVYGTEYESISLGRVTFNDDVPCAVCRSPVRPSVLILPGRNSCYQGWTHEYNGYMASGGYQYKAATEYICLDHDPEAVPHGYENKDGAFLYYVASVCGSLSCPPYVDKKTLSCVVCSK